MPRILLVDCDQFFVQCARLADPEGAGREALLLVGGSAQGRGVVTSASYETRAYGVRSGMPTVTAQRMCPKAVVVPVPGKMCRDKSRAVRAVLERFTPVVEPASVDEAYMDMSGTERLYHGESLADTARRIQHGVFADAEIVVSIGGGTNRLIAKLAVSRAKPAGVHIVPPGDEAAFLAEHEIGDIPGVGPVLTAELAKFGLVKVTDALPMTETQLTTLLGEGRGAWLYKRMRGIADSTVHTHSSAKSLSRDETFARDLHTEAELLRELRMLIRRLGRDLRADELRARTITVRLRDADFRTRQASHTVQQGIQTERAIYTVARPLLARLRAQRRIGARLIGISAANLAAQAEAQLALLDDTAALETERERTLARVADQVRKKYGPDAIAQGDSYAK